MMSPSTTLSLTVVLIFAAADVSAKTVAAAGFGDGAENGIKDEGIGLSEDNDAKLEEDFGFSFDDLSDFGEDEDEGFGFDGDANILPQCSELTYFELELGTACSNESAIPEVRINDALSERLIRQVWIDIRAKLKDDGEFRGMVIDPLDVDAHLTEPIDIRQIASAYSANVKMSGIKLLGLSSIRLDEASVTRDENLTDLHVNVKLGFDELTISGVYELKGRFGWWEVDSNGTRDFAIEMVNASFASMINFERVEESDSESGCGPEGNVVISEMGFPLRYDAVNFRFDNLGPFVNNMVNGIGAYFLQMQEELIIKEIKSVIKTEVNSLLC